MKKTISMILVFAMAFGFIRNDVYGYLFINSLPMNANVYIDGEYAGVSPLLIKEDMTGTHEIRYEKPEYFDMSTTIDVQDSVTNIYSFLTPRTFSIYFPNQTSVVINEETFNNEQIHNLPNGYYYFESGTNYVDMTRLNPDRKFFWFSLALTTAGLLSAVIGQVNAESQFKRFQEASELDDAIAYLKQTAFWDNFSYVGLGFVGVGAGMTLYFGLDNKRFNKESETFTINSVDEKEVDSELYDNAMSYVSSDYYESALEIFDRIVDEYPDSKYNPISLYRRAGIYEDQGLNELAITDLELIKNEYPIYDLYPLTLNSLAGIYYERGDYTSALENYTEIGELNDSYLVETEYWSALSYYQLSLENPEDSAYSQKAKEIIADYIDNTEYPEYYKEELSGLFVESATE